MRRLILTACLALPLAACETVLSGIQKCERHYSGTISGGVIQPAVMAGDAAVDCCPAGTYARREYDAANRPVRSDCVPLPPGTPLALGRTVAGPG